MANEIQNLLIQAQTAIENALTDVEIKEYVSAFGYDEAALNTGKSLLENAESLNRAQIKEYGDQYTATEVLNKNITEARAEYIRFVKIARVAFKNDHDIYAKLGLAGTRKRSVNGWLAQAEKFYTNALENPAVLEKFSKFGVTPEKLTKGRQLISTTKESLLTQKQEKGEAQQATLARDKAIDALEDWLSDFTAIARIALEEKPQLLEKLGILERS